MVASFLLFLQSNKLYLFNQIHQENCMFDKNKSGYFRALVEFI